MPPPSKSQEDEDPTPYLFISLEQKRIDQTKPYDAKKACWVPDEKEGYLLGEIKATKGDVVSVTLPGGEVRHFLSVSSITKFKFDFYRSIRLVYRCYSTVRTSLHSCTRYTCTYVYLGTLVDSRRIIKDRELSKRKRKANGVIFSYYSYLCLCRVAVA